jgi:hypothetical protein
VENEGLKKTAIALRLAILLCATLCSLGAQPSRRTVQGVVVDEHSHPLEHAVVQIKNDWTLLIRSYITQADGKYHFAGLNSEVDYEVTAEYDGRRSSVRTLNKFDSREEPKIDLIIHLGK